MRGELQGADPCVTAAVQPLEGETISASGSESHRLSVYVFQSSVVQTRAELHARNMIEGRSSKLRYILWVAHFHLSACIKFCMGIYSPLFDGYLPLILRVLEQSTFHLFPVSCIMTTLASRPRRGRLVSDLHNSPLVQWVVIPRTCTPKVTIRLP